MRAVVNEGDRGDDKRGYMRSCMRVSARKMCPEYSITSYTNIHAIYEQKTRTGGRFLVAASQARMGSVLEERRYRGKCGKEA